MMRLSGEFLALLTCCRSTVKTLMLTRWFFRTGTIPEGSANLPNTNDTNGQEGNGANPGSISVYAQATDVTKETKDGVDSTLDQGTSYSSPEVVSVLPESRREELDTDTNTCRRPALQLISSASLPQANRMSQARSHSR